MWNEMMILPQKLQFLIFGHKLQSCNFQFSAFITQSPNLQLQALLTWHKLEWSKVQTVSYEISFFPFGGKKLQKLNSVFQFQRLSSTNFLDKNKLFLSPNGVNFQLWGLSSPNFLSNRPFLPDDVFDSIHVCVCAHYVNVHVWTCVYECKCTNNWAWNVNLIKYYILRLDDFWTLAAFSLSF